MSCILGYQKLPQPRAGASTLGGYLQLSASCSSLLHWDDSTLAFPGFSWGSCSLGVLDSFTLLAPWLPGYLALLLFDFWAFRFFIFSEYWHSCILVYGWWGCGSNHKTEGVLCLFSSYYTTFPEVFNVLDLLDYAERGVQGGQVFDSRNSSRCCGRRLFLLACMLARLLHLC